MVDPWIQSSELRNPERYEGVVSAVVGLPGVHQVIDQREVLEPFFDVLNSLQVAALGIVKELDHPVVGKYQTIDVPWLCSEPMAELSPVPAPSLGEHTEEALKDLGYTAEQIDQLVRAGVIGQKPSAQ